MAALSPSGTPLYDIVRQVRRARSGGPRTVRPAIRLTATPEPRRRVRTLRKQTAGSKRSRNSSVVSKRRCRRAQRPVRRKRRARRPLTVGRRTTLMRSDDHETAQQARRIGIRDWAIRLTRVRRPRPCRPVARGRCGTKSGNPLRGWTTIPPVPLGANTIGARCRGKCRPCDRRLQKSGRRARTRLTLPWKPTYQIRD